eukprot:COSAG06_NODE_9925_length_1789_cov_1.328994_2_plen_36_part_00
MISALDTLGADPTLLTDDQKLSLDEQGFVKISGSY